jgi:hypothetical protein
MPRLNTLFYALIQVIANYCEQRGDASPSTYVFVTNEPSNETKQETLDIPSQEELVRWIESIPGERKTLMAYLLHAVTLLRPQIEHPTTLSQTEADQFKEQLISIISTLQRLLELSPTKQISISYDEKDAFIQGCQPGVLIHSVSGTLIENQVFQALNLSIQASEAVCKQFVNDMIHEHQYPLLLIENEQLRQGKALLREEYNTKLNSLYAVTNEFHELQEEADELRKALRHATGNEVEPRPYQPQKKDLLWSTFWGSNKFIPMTIPLSQEINVDPLEGLI